MLSRTASELYWMARYLERAESIARVLDVTKKLSMMPIRDGGDQDLQVPLNLTGTGQLYAAAYPELTMPNLVSFFALDNRNHSSIFSCLQMDLQADALTLESFFLLRDLFAFSTLQLK